MTVSVRYNYNLFMVMTGLSPQIYEETTLDNGLRMVTCEMPHTRSVSISAYVGVGSRFETDDEAGLSHFVEHMMFKGTESRPDPLDISAQIESSGGAINAGTEQELTVYWCKGRPALLRRQHGSDGGYASQLAVPTGRHREGAQRNPRRACDDQRLPLCAGGLDDRRDAVAGPPAGTRRRRHSQVGGRALGAICC